MGRALVRVLTCISLLGIGAALAQPYPTRPVTLIVPYGAGGPLDTLTRIVSERMRIPLGRSLVIENVSGASGTVGVGRAVRAAPDGYTVSVGNWPTHVVNGAMFALPYDLLRDFEPVALVKRMPALPRSDRLRLATSRRRLHLLVCEIAMTPFSPSIAMVVSNAAERLRRFSRSWRAFAPCMRVGWNSFES